MAKFAWLLHGFWLPELTIGFDFEEQSDTQFVDNYVYKKRQGLPLEAHEVPKSLQLMFDESPKKLLRCPPAFNGPGMVVCEGIADVLRGFRLGKTQLFPINVMMGKDRTPAPCSPYFLLCIGERRERLLPELSKGLEAVRNTPNRWQSGLDMCRDAIVLDGSLPMDVDLWYDPLDIHGRFCSDELHSALKAAGYGRALRPVRCRFERPTRHSGAAETRAATPMARRSFSSTQAVNRHQSPKRSQGCRGASGARRLVITS